MVIEHVLQIFLLHLLLVGDWLEHALIVLRRAGVHKHRRINRRVVQCRWLLASMIIRAAHRALLGPSDAGRNDEIEAELARLHLLLVQVAEGAIAAATLLLVGLPRAGDVYLLKLAALIVATAVS